MKKISKLFIVLMFFSILFLVGCMTPNSDNQIGNNSDVVAGEEVSGATSEIEIKEDTISGEFIITNSKLIFLIEGLVNLYDIWFKTFFEIFISMSTILAV